MVRHPAPCHPRSACRFSTKLASPKTKATSTLFGYGVMQRTCLGLHEKSEKTTSHNMWYLTWRLTSTSVWCLYNVDYTCLGANDRLSGLVFNYLKHNTDTVAFQSDWQVSDATKGRMEKILKPNMYESRDAILQTRHGIRYARPSWIYNDAILPHLTIQYPRMSSNNSDRPWGTYITCDWRELLTNFFAHEKLYHRLLQGQNEKPLPTST